MKGLTTRNLERNNGEGQSNVATEELANRNLVIQTPQVEGGADSPSRVEETKEGEVEIEGAERGGRGTRSLE